LVNSSFKIGVDVGGTFIDLAVVDGTGRSRLYKSLSDPGDLAGALLAGLEVVARDEQITLSELLSRTETIIHGSTVATNALLTKHGAKTALVTTEGFRDVLNMRRGMRLNLYDPKQAPPNPLVPRHLIHVVEERIDCEGTEVTAVNEESLKLLVDRLAEAGVESVAVAFVFSFFNNSHEKIVAAKLREWSPNIHISLSSEVLPEVRLYERISTTAVNAYVTPVLARYLDSLEARLQQTGFAGRLLIMQSNGGVSGCDVGKQLGVGSILSGPAAGPVAGIRYSSLYGISNVITVDMGGTSFDVSLVKNGEIEVTKEMEIAGYRIALPLVAVHTIGAGGGSIISVDDRGLLQVGPESAGSSPGPVCYDRGGNRPTITDADLVVGYLDAHRFWGGRLRLNTEAAYQALEKHVAQPLHMDPIRAAYGAYQVVNANMVDAIREVSVRRGHDPREFLLVAGGGAGPIHASAIARELDIPLMLVPRDASVMCAVGQLLSDLRHDFVRSYLASLDKLDSVRAHLLCEEMETQAVDTLLSEGIPRDKIVLALSADVRYIGQFNEVEVPLASDGWTAAGIEQLVGDFHRRHEALNGYRMPSAPIEIVNLRVVGTGIVDKPQMMKSASSETQAALSPIGHRKAFFDNGFTEVPVYDGFQLPPACSINGPAIVEQSTTTVIVQPGYQLSCDDFGNYLVYRDGVSLEESIAVLKRGQAE
jgi:N-methylhydantoinase A